MREESCQCFLALPTSCLETKGRPDSPGAWFPQVRICGGWAGSRQLIVLMGNWQGASAVLGLPSHPGAELPNENEGVTHKPVMFGVHFVL